MDHFAKVFASSRRRKTFHEAFDKNMSMCYSRENKNLEYRLKETRQSRTNKHFVLINYAKGRARK